MIFKILNSIKTALSFILLILLSVVFTILITALPVYVFGLENHLLILFLIVIIYIIVSFVLFDLLEEIFF